ncbi:MAG: family N-acetyltransferase [Flavipsychrobacter sp.]|jgi:hypothetical protein|nr:family N-acetyltransferase [Flavipsychrobacter sp.]
MRTIETNILLPEHKEALRNIWNTEYPAKLAMFTPQDMENYLASLSDPKHYLLLNDIDMLSGWAATFTRENDNWFAIIMHAAYQKQGLGGWLLEMLKVNNNTLNGWVADHNNDRKQNGKTYTSPLPFYLKNGFIVQSDTRLEMEKLSAVKIQWTRS